MFIPSNAGPDLRWLDDSGCAELDITDFFVEAGHVISEEVLEICRTCPVRKECVSHAFGRGIVGGYFGGISPGQRRDMKDVEEAYAYIDNDPPKTNKADLQGEGMDLVNDVPVEVLARLRGLMSKVHRATHDEDVKKLRERAESYATANGLSLDQLEVAGIV